MLPIRGGGGAEGYIDCRVCNLVEPLPFAATAYDFVQTRSCYTLFGIDIVG